MTRLERRYRLLLRVLPRWYRVKRENEMVGIFLADRDDDLDLEYGWPGWPEVSAVLGLAARTRLAVHGGPPRAVALGDAVRLVALIGLLTFSARAVAEAVAFMASILRLQPALVGPDAWTYVFRACALAAVVAFVLLLNGRHTAAKLFAAVAVLPSLIRFGLDPPVNAEQWWLAVTNRAPQWIVTGCLFAGFHRDAPTPAARPWLRAAVVGGAVALCCWSWIEVTGVIPGNRPVAYFLVDRMSLPTAALLLGGVAYLTLIRPRNGHGGGPDRTGAWPVALAACAALLVPPRVASLHFFLAADRAGEYSDMVVINMVQLAALIAVGAWLATIGISDYRRLPARVPPARRQQT